MTAKNDLIIFKSLTENRLHISFQRYLQKCIAPLLQQAMMASVMNGGKRLRPLLVYVVASLFDAPLENADAPACAIELIHCFSLIHDDLPAMDNADFRRGQPACHRAFDEATAILAGDALQSLAFEILATHPSALSATQRLAMIATLAEATGMHGMTGGQALDLNGATNFDGLTTLNQLKTGALLKASVRLGCLAAGNILPTVQTAIEKYIDCLGLAYQLQDDLLDCEGTLETSGKLPGTDLQNNKQTAPYLLGKKETQKKITALHSEALASIAPLGDHFEVLRELAQSLVSRSK